MGIFDDIVQGINREFNRVQTKSQEMMQTYSLNSQIRQLEGKVTANFLEIGRLIYDKYERNKEVSEELLREKTAQISEWEREVASLKAELDSVKAQYDPDSTAAQKSEAKAGYTATPGFTCPNCQAPANQSKPFCPACGTALSVDATVVEPATEGNGSDKD